MSFISIKNLYFSYKSGSLDIPIFKDFNLEIEKGDFVAIKGPSGSGKSTLLYLIAGLLKSNGGSIHFDGKDIEKLSDIELSLLRNKRIAFVFQQFHLLPKTNVLDNILLPTYYPIESNEARPDRKAKAAKIANDLGIGDRLTHISNQLSGGQQQRVAIARALINDADVILADEPTGNLDSKSTAQILAIFKKLHAEGKTIVLITHDEEVARSASTVYQLKDGALQNEHRPQGEKRPVNETASSLPAVQRSKIPFSNYLKLIPISISHAFRNRTRSILTMLGITVGVAAVCSMVTLGNFTKDKILDSYAELGVNTIQFRGYPNWQLKATDKFPVKFQFFNWETDLVPLKRIFPAIHLISPNMTSWQTTVTYAGKSIESDPQLVGVSEDGLKVLNRQIIAGRGISQFHVERKYSVCVIGHEIGSRLFKNTSPIDQVIHVSQDNSTFACKVIGVLEPKTSNKEWSKPNLQVYVPFTLFQAVSEHWWRSQIKEVTIQFHQGVDIEKAGKAIRTFFEQKYGLSGDFRVDSDSILVAQMKKFLTLFSVLLASIALVSLTVGGMGITNMMLVSVSERLKEIGIRKSVGASNFSVRYQFMFESVFLCGLAGVIGISFGVAAYQGAIFGASKLMSKLTFEWVFDPFAMSLSFISIIAVGVLSGLAPALKAERLSVVEALRSE